MIANPILRDEELERLRQVDSDVFQAHTIDTTWPVADGPDGLEARRRAHLRGGRRGARRRREHPRPLRPRRRAGARADPVAARGLGRAPPPRPRGHAAPGRAGRRVGRAAQRAQRRGADRLRRRRGQPVPDARDARRARRARLAAAGDDEGGGAAPRDEGDRQGPAEDDLEDGHLDDPVLLRRADLRGGRALERARRPPLHRHAVAHRRHRHRRARARDARPARARLPRQRGRAAAGRRPLRLAARRRAPPWNPETIALLQHAVRAGGYETYEEYSPLVNDDSARRSTLRGLLRFREPPRTAASRSTRSSRRRRSSSASRPARCRSARSRARRTRRSRSR